MLAKSTLLRTSVALLMGLGVYMAVTTSASSGSAVGTLEAEAMTITPAAAGQVVSDAGASGGRAVRLETNGSVTGAVTLAAPATSLTVTAKGSSCRGNPSLTISVDGVQAAVTQVGSSSWGAYSFPKNLTAASHSVSLAFTNDYSRKNCSRSLLLDAVDFYGDTSNSTNITPSPTPTSTPTAPAPVQALWSGDFESGDLSQWSLNQSCPGGVTIGTNPLRSGKYATAFTVTDQSTNANCPAVPTSSPRAQLVGPGLFHNGDEYYIGFSTYFPSNFPTITSWFQFAEIYGPPFGGSPSMGFDVTGDRLVMDRDPSHNWDTIWTSPSDITKGTAWEDIIVHVKFSTDPSVGFVELWRNGVQQKFTNGSTRIYYDTLVPGVNWDGSSPNRLYLNQYRSSSVSLGSVTLWHDAARVGTSYASVQP